MERKPIRIQQGNDCLLKMLPKMVDGTPVPAYLLSDIEIKLNATTVEDWATEGDYITIPLPDNQPLGTYDITLTAKIGDRDVRDCRTALFCRVPNGEGIPYEEYCSEFTIITVTDDELEALKIAAEQARQEWLVKQAEAEAKKQEYADKIEALDEVAKESNATANKNEIIQEVRTAQPDLSQVAKEQTLQTNTQTIIQEVRTAQPDLSSVAKEAQATANKNEIIHAVETAQPDLSTVAKEAQATANKQEVLQAIADIEVPLPTGIATEASQQIIMQGFNFGNELADMQALTDTEIINTYDGYEDEGEHIEGIADTTYGHRRPVQVTIDEVTHTFYVERTYSDYGYSVLYRNGVAIDTTTTHPQEDDELTTTNE